VRQEIAQLASLLAALMPEGASTPVPMKLSGHTSVRSLAKYARVSDEELRRHQADSDPAARRRAGSLIRGDDADHAWATDWACLLWGG